MDRIHKVFDENDLEIELKFKKKMGLIVQRQTGNLVFVSGHGPEDSLTYEPLYTGRIGKDLTLDEGRAAARECAVLIINALKCYLGNLDRIVKFVRVMGLVNCAEGFNRLDEVMDGFSDTVADIFEERGHHVRTIMGTHNLPNKNIPVEIEVIVEVKD